MRSEGSALPAGEPSFDLRAARRSLLGEEGPRGVEFCGAYSDLVDVWLSELGERTGIGEGSGIAVVAVGSYGRRQLCPGSDLDVTLVHSGRRPPQVAAESLWYPVWGAGVGLDHSVRSLRQAVSTMEEDLRVALGFLDARLVVGDSELAIRLYEETRNRWKKLGSRWLAALSARIDERHERFGEVAFLLEPDLKDAKGGTRDLDALRAAATGSPVVGDPLPDEALRSALGTLLAARVELHRRTGRAVNRLVLQEQDGVAGALGYADADELMAAVAHSGRTVAWAADDGWRRVGSWLEGPPRGRAYRDRPLGEGVVLRDAEVALSADADPVADPAVALRAGGAAAELGVPLARSALESLSAVGELEPPWPAEARQALVALLGAGRPSIEVLEALDVAGALVRLLPEWQPVRSRPQRNALHRFTVDRHLCETAAEAASLVRSVRRPDLLLLGAWLHDIGKGYPGDHTEAGMGVVAEVARRIGLSPDDAGTLVSMVRHHLLLPDTATRRDTSDPATVEAVAGAVGDPEMLDLLAALAQADGLATGPAAWGPWKAALVADLVGRVRDSMAGSPPRPAAPAPTERHGPLTAGLEPRVLTEGSTVTVVAPDRPGLLSAAAGVLALHGLAILSASAASEAGTAVEEFHVQPDRGATPRWEGIQADLQAALAGRLPLAERLAERERAYATARGPGAALPAEPKVLVYNEASASSTVVEVRSKDSVGLLYHVTAVLARHRLDVVTARMSTLGHEVVDAFYVRAHGAKLTDQPALELLREDLLAALVH